MKALIIIICLLPANNSIGQILEKIDSLVTIINNDSLNSVYYAPNVIERDSLGNVLYRKTYIGSYDPMCYNLFLLGTQSNEVLLEHFMDEDKDYAINLIFYMLYRKDAVDMFSYQDINSINDWKKYRKEKDYLYWREVVGK
ncbi:hypothetical protein D3C71_899810 [compost metagenome]